MFKEKLGHYTLTLKGELALVLQYNFSLKLKKYY